VHEVKFYELFLLGFGSFVGGLVSAAMSDWKYRRRDRAFENIAFRLGRHLRNPDQIGIHDWGAGAMDLLAELREMDPERYDREVKPCKP
jgi:hypothetical protein